MVRFTDVLRSGSRSRKLFAVPNDKVVRSKKMSAFAASHPTKLTTARTYSLSRRRQLCAIAEIQSSKNPRVKFARALLLRRQREKTDKILLEGQRLIKDALEAGTKPHSLFYTLQAMENETTNKVIHQNMKQQGADNVCVSDNVLASISDTIHPQVCCIYYHFTCK